MTSDRSLHVLSDKATVDDLALMKKVHRSNSSQIGNSQGESESCDNGGIVTAVASDAEGKVGVVKRPMAPPPQPPSPSTDGGVAEKDIAVSEVLAGFDKAMAEVDTPADIHDHKAHATDPSPIKSDDLPEATEQPEPKSSPSILEVITSHLRERNRLNLDSSISATSSWSPASKDSTQYLDSNDVTEAEPKVAMTATEQGNRQGEVTHREDIAEVSAEITASNYLTKSFIRTSTPLDALAPISPTKEEESSPNRTKPLVPPKSYRLKVGYPRSVSDSSLPSKPQPPFPTEATTSVFLKPESTEVRREPKAKPQRASLDPSKSDISSQSNVVHGITVNGSTDNRGGDSDPRNAIMTVQEVEKVSEANAKHRIPISQSHVQEPDVRRSVDVGVGTPPPRPLPPQPKPPTNRRAPVEGAERVKANHAPPIKPARPPPLSRTAANTQRNGRSGEVSTSVAGVVPRSLPPPPSKPFSQWTVSPVTQTLPLSQQQKPPRDHNRHIESRTDTAVMATPGHVTQLSNQSIELSGKSKSSSSLDTSLSDISGEISDVSSTNLSYYMSPLSDRSSNSRSKQSPLATPDVSAAINEMSSRNLSAYQSPAEKVVEETETAQVKPPRSYRAKEVKEAEPVIMKPQEAYSDKEVKKTELVKVKPQQAHSDKVAEETEPVSRKPPPSYDDYLLQKYGSLTVPDEVKAIWSGQNGESASASASVLTVKTVHSTSAPSTQVASNASTLPTKPAQSIPAVPSQPSATASVLGSQAALSTSALQTKAATSMSALPSQPLSSTPALPSQPAPSTAALDIHPASSTSVLPTQSTPNSPVSVASTDSSNTLRFFTPSVFVPRHGTSSASDTDTKMTKPQYTDPGSVQGVSRKGRDGRLSLSPERPVSVDAPVPYHSPTKHHHVDRSDGHNTGSPTSSSPGQKPPRPPLPLTVVAGRSQAAAKEEENAQDKAEELASKYMALNNGEFESDV